MDYIKTNHIKNFVNTLQIENKPARMSGDFIEGLNTKVEQLVCEAKLRAELNGRSTLKSKDL